MYWNPQKIRMKAKELGVELRELDYDGTRYWQFRASKKTNCNSSEQAWAYLKGYEAAVKRPEITRKLELAANALSIVWVAIQGNSIEYAIVEYDPTVTLGGKIKAALLGLGYKATIGPKKCYYCKGSKRYEGDGIEQGCPHCCGAGTLQTASVEPV
jgi:hypothetical protein